MPEFNKVCMQYHFKTGQLDTMIFVKVDQIFELNIETLEFKTIYTFKEELSEQPSFFLGNHKQDIFVISTED
jgi:hypothetical protein